MFGAPPPESGTAPRSAGALRLARLLADGAEHSGASLAARLGVTRAAVFQQVRRLRGYGLAVHARRGRGYRLAAPLALLDEARIGAALRAAGSRIAQVRCVDTVGSTSDALSGAAPATLYLAEHQSAGRGRRGRAWSSPFGVNLYLSLSWRYEAGPAALGGLSLALGVSLAQCLRRYVPAVGLKWPNDLYLQGRKLGGVLVELAGQAEGPCEVIAGVGINVNMQNPLEPPDQPWASLAQQGGALDRSALAAEVALAVEAALADFPQPGLAAYLARWEALDVLRGAPVVATWNGAQVTGVAQGIDASGALAIATPAGVWILAAGEVSVRPCTSS